MNYTIDHELDPIFAALANGHRRRVIDLLSLQPASIGQLADRVGLTLTAIHRHIHVLENAGLVRRKKVGRTNFLALDRSAMMAVQAWAGGFRADWGTNDESLQNYAASIERAASITKETR